ncbi:nucleoporin [Fomitiporia mediterranea MF3/22]|uniref:nucleoporin n=1 Tax=Fomitiporia mediterranea (strain MF3/22) TaxID=694068 RepID=UPI0004407EE0|nr:nucleoporin [Fomitiporia mediterranea MF3/22]EJD04002.1 nucleoporin [Fomitiporia mediterranea MF3/22]
MAFAGSFASSRPFSGLHDAPVAESYASSSRAKPPPPRPSLDLPALQEASRLIQEQFIKDAQIVPDLGDMLSMTPGQSSASYTIFPGDYRVPYQKRKHVGIPPALWEHFQTSKFICHMGIMAEIERAWIALDHKLFLWDYIEGQELSSFVEQPDVITHVALVKPKPNVFVDEITSLLVICTQVSVVLLGLSSQASAGPDYRKHKEIKLYATDMSVSTDGVEMTSVTGTEDGRIFMCGVGDGCVYELHYQEKEVWFGKRFHLVNHSAGAIPSFIPLFRTAHNEERVISVVFDQARNYIYTLSEHNWISVWKPEPNKVLRKVQTLSNLQKQAQDKAPGAPALLQGLRLLSLHVIEQRESKSGIQLVALSQNGVRLYFSSAPASYGGYGYGVQYGPVEPKQLHLIHVRLPPMNLVHPDEQLRPHAAPVYGTMPQTVPGSSPWIVKDLTAAAYVDGLLVAAQPSDVDGKDFILGISPDLSRIGSLGQAQPPSAPQAPAPSYYHPAATGGYLPPPTTSRPPLTEQATLLYVEGTIWAIASSETNGPAPAIASTSPQPVTTNDLATQFSHPQHEFIIVTNVGISHLVKRRTLDYLRDAIEEALSEGNLQPIIDFRDSFGRDQTCAMLLALASGNTFLATEKNRHSLYDDVGTVGSEMAALAKQAFYDLADRPIWVDRGYGGDGQGNVIFSGRREGLALYFARLVRPLWRARITKTGPSGQSSNFDDRTLVAVQRNLYALKNMLDSNPQLFSSTPSDQVGAGGRQHAEHDAWKVEAASVSHLHALIGRTAEAIAFVLLLIDYHLGDLVAQCDKDTQTLISSLTYEELIAAESGLHVSRMLVNVIINSQIGQQISIDTVSEILQQRCGSFCSADDVMLYKAQENVRKAVDLRDPNEKQVVLGESLRLFTRAARVIEFEKLREICGDYQHLNYVKGAIELPLQCAAVADEDNVGLNYWLSGSPANDPRSDLLEKRRKCYELIIHSLLVFDEQCAKNPARQDFEEVRSLAYELSLSSEDPVFHSHLYEWMVKQGMTDRLLELRPFFLEAHLLREPASADKYQLLWQLYVKNGQYLKAAEVLAALARSFEFDLPLQARLEFLTLAVSNAKSHPVSVNGKHEAAIAFLSELGDQLEVAQVQMELFYTLLPRIDEPGEVGEQIQLLQKRLFNVTELYQLYAEPFDLSSIKLLILHVSEHRDEAIVKPIWNAIFDEVTSTGTPDEQADRLSSIIVTHGRRFYPSECAFPLRYAATLLVKFTLSNIDVRPPGWAPRVLKECGVPYSEIWDILHEMYESQVPPFSNQQNIQAVSSDIAIVLKDWVEDARRPQSSLSRGDLPVDLIDRSITKYIEELAPDRKETKAVFEDVKRQLHRYW